MARAKRPPAPKKTASKGGAKGRRPTRLAFAKKGGAKRSAKKTARGEEGAGALSAPGSLARWPGAALGAGLAAAGLLWGFGGFPTQADALLALPWQHVGAAALCFGAMAAWAVGAGPLGGLVGASLGVASAGLFTPLGLTPDNWSVALMGIALGGAAHGPSARPRVRPLAIGLVLVGVGLLLGDKGLTWATAALGGTLGAWRASPLNPKRLGALQGLLALIGLLLTINAGFVRVDMPVSRALLVEWGEHSRVLPGQSRDAIWTGGEQVVYRALVDGPTFKALPLKGPGLELPSRKPDAIDLAELGLAPDCEALAELALEGDARARAQVVLRRCEPGLRELAASDPLIDAAWVLRGASPADAAAIVATPVDLPLTEPGAVLLVAKARLGAPKAAAKALVDGGPYDRALLLAHLRAAERQALTALIQQWSVEVPGPEGQDYYDALDALQVE